MTPKKLKKRNYLQEIRQLTRTIKHYEEMHHVCDDRFTQQQDISGKKLFKLQQENICLKTQVNDLKKQVEKVSHARFELFNNLSEENKNLKASNEKLKDRLQRDNEYTHHHSLKNLSIAQENRKLLQAIETINNLTKPDIYYEALESRIKFLEEQL